MTHFISIIPRSLPINKQHEEEEKADEDNSILTKK